MGMWDKVKTYGGYVFGGAPGLLTDGGKGKQFLEDNFGPAKPKQEGIPGYEGMVGQIDQQMGGLGPQYQQQFDEYLKGLQDMAAGRGESLAEQQFKQASAQGQQQVAALAASGRGNPAQAQRQAIAGQAQMGQGLAQGSAQARLQEQMAAQGQLGQAIAQGDQSTLAHQQQWLQYMQAKMGISAEQAQNLLGYYQALAGQPTAMDRMMNLGSTVAGVAAGA